MRGLAGARGGRVRVRISREGWRVWNRTGRVGTITCAGGRYTLLAWPSGRPVAFSRTWVKVAQFAREHY